MGRIKTNKRARKYPLVMTKKKLISELKEIEHNIKHIETRYKAGKSVEPILERTKHVIEHIKKH